MKNLAGLTEMMSSLIQPLILGFNEQLRSGEVLSELHPGKQMLSLQLSGKPGTYNVHVYAGKQNSSQNISLTCRDDGRTESQSNNSRIRTEHAI